LAVVLKRGDEASLSIRVHFWLLFSEKIRNGEIFCNQESV